MVQRLRSDRARSSCRCHRHSPLPTSARSCISAALAGSRFPKAAMHGARVVRRTRMGPGANITVHEKALRRAATARRLPRAWILEAAARQHMKRCVRPSASWGHGHVGRCGGGAATRNITSGVVLVAGAHRGYLAAHKRLVLADRGAAQWLRRRESFDLRLHGGSRPYACTRKCTACRRSTRGKASTFNTCGIMQTRSRSSPRGMSSLT